MGYCQGYHKQGMHNMQHERACGQTTSCQGHSASPPCSVQKAQSSAVQGLFKSMTPWAAHQVAHGGVLGQDGDAALALQVVAVHYALLHRLICPEDLPGTVHADLLHARAQGLANNGPE